jgi:hypothetical protein
MSRLLRQISFRELDGRVQGLSKLNVVLGASAEAGTANTRHFVRRFLPAIRYHNPEAVVTVVKKAEPGTKSLIEASFGANAGSKVFDPRAKDVEIFSELLGREAPPLSSLAPLYSSRSSTTPAAADGAAAGPSAEGTAAAAAPADPFVGSILKAAKGSYRVHGSAGQGEYIANKKKWGRKREKLGLPPLKGRAKTGAGSSKS